MAVLTRGAYADPSTSLAFKTGNWRSTEKPAHVHFKAPCHAACPAGEETLLLTPARHDTDGFFVAMFRRCEGP